jgi:hypothetical protein
MRVSTIKHLINGLKDTDEIHFIKYDDGNGYSYMAMTEAELITEAEDGMLRDGLAEDEVAERLTDINEVMEYLAIKLDYEYLEL